MQADIAYSCARASEPDLEYSKANEKITIDHFLIQVDVEATHELDVVDITHEVRVLLP